VPARHPKVAAILKEKSLKRGHFVLASGATSDYYIDGKMTCLDPIGASLIAEAILEEIADLPVAAVGGMDMGATPIVGSLAVKLADAKRLLPVFVVRKETKAHGTMKPIEGPLPAPCAVAIIDDVVTSGGSIIKAIDAVEAVGCKVLLAISVLDRNAGATEALAARNIPYRPLVTLADLGISTK